MTEREGKEDDRGGTAEVRFILLFLLFLLFVVLRGGFNASVFVVSQMTRA